MSINIQFGEIDTDQNRHSPHSFAEALDRCLMFLMSEAETGGFKLTEDALKKARHELMTDLLMLEEPKHAA